MARWTPRPLSSWRRTMATSRSCIRTLSVISRARHSGGSPESRRAAATCAARVVAEQVVGGKVDVQQQRAGLGHPAGHLAAGLPEHEAVQLDDPAGLLGQGDALARRD